MPYLKRFELPLSDHFINGNGINMNLDFKTNKKIAIASI